jgi:hypothetical protein
LQPPTRFLERLAVFGENPGLSKSNASMKKFLQIGATTCIVGFGVWFALFFAGGVCTLFGEGDSGLFRTLSIFSIAGGVVAALFWAFRRTRGRPVRIPEWILLVVAFLSLSGLAEHLIAEEVHGFLAFDPRVAAQRAVQRYAPIKAGDTFTFTFLGTTSMGVRVYSMERDGKPRWVVGVSPRYRLWWIMAFDMDLEDYEKMEQQGTLEKPQK